MKRLSLRLLIVISSLYIFHVHASLGGQLADEFLNALTPIKAVTEFGQPVPLSDFLTAIKVPLPGKLKSALEKVIIEAPQFIVDAESRSATFQGGASLFGQRIVVKVRFAYGSVGAGIGEPTLLESAYQKPLPEPAAPKEEAGKVTMSEAELKKMANQKQVNLPVKGKEEVVAATTKTDSALKSMLKEASGVGAPKEPKEGAAFQQARASVTQSVGDIMGKFNGAIIIGMPGAFKFANIDSALAVLDIIEFSGIALVLATAPLYEPEFGRTFFKGINFVGTARMSGPLDKINSLIGSNLTAVTLSGVVDPGIWGSMLTAELPGKINMGSNVETSGLLLRVALEEPTMTVSVLTGLNVKVPNSDPLQFRAGLKYVPPTEFILGGWMDGMWNRPFGVPFFSIGELGVQAGIDLTSAASTLGILSLSTVGVRGVMGFGEKTVEMAMSISLATSSPDLLLSGKFEGGLGLQDVATVGAMVIDQSAKIGGKNLGLKDKVQGKIPNIGIKNAQIYISPKDVSLAGRYFKKGVIVGGGIELLGQTAEMQIEMDPQTVSAMATMSEINLGPLKFTGAGKGKQRDGFEQGPIASFVIEQSAPYVQLFIDARAELNILGGLVADTRINFSIKGIEFWLKTQIFNQFMSDLEFSTPDFFKPKDWKVICKMQQEGLDNFAKLLEQGADEMLKAAQRDIAKAQEGVDKAKQALDKLAQERTQIEQQNKSNLESSMKTLRDKVNSLKREKDALEAQIAKCKGEAPKEAQSEVASRIAPTEFVATAQTIAQSSQELAQQGYNSTQIELIQQQLWARAGVRELVRLRGLRQLWQVELGRYSGSDDRSQKGRTSATDSGLQKLQAMADADFNKNKGSNDFAQREIARVKNSAKQIIQELLFGKKPIPAGFNFEQFLKGNDLSPAGREKDVNLVAETILVNLGMPAKFIDPVREIMWDQEVEAMMGPAETATAVGGNVMQLFGGLINQRKQYELGRTGGNSAQSIEQRIQFVVNYARKLSARFDYPKGMPESQKDEYFMTAWLPDLKKALEARKK